LLDTVLLGVAATKTKNPMLFGLVAASVMAIVVDLLCAQRLSRDQNRWF